MIDTQDEMLTTPPPPVRPPRSIHRVWAVPMTVIAFLAVTGLLLATMLPGDIVAKNRNDVDAPYALVPADAQAVEPRISFSAVDRHPAAGEILFVTIREPQITLMDWFVGRGQGEVELLSHDDKYGVETPSQQQTFNLQDMISAKAKAEYVALHLLGYPATIVPGAAIVQSIICLDPLGADPSACTTLAPAGTVLQRGDTLTKVDGKALETVDDLKPILAAHQPGDRIDVEFTRPGEGAMSGTVETIAAPGETPVRTIIGFSSFDTSTAQLPFDVGIDSGEIGGPSAGLAFTLTLLDELTPGELTGGHKVAVTGTIGIDGKVGAIGGLTSKTSAVKQMGATVFIVPTNQGPDDIAAARAVAGDGLQIIPVADVNEALAALAKIGGNGLDLGTPGADYVPA